MQITGIELERLRLPLDPPFFAAWDPDPRRRFDATIVRVHTDEGVTGIGSGDTMSGFADFEHLFLGRDPLALAAHARTLETIAFHAGRFWALEAALWDLAGKALDAPVATLLGGSAQRIAAYASLGELRPPVNVQVRAPALRSRAIPRALVRDVLVVVPSVEDDSAELVAARADGGCSPGTTGQ